LHEKIARTKKREEKKEKKGKNVFFHNSCHFPYLFIKKDLKNKIGSCL
jgi:hypothetical protein